MNSVSLKNAKFSTSSFLEQRKVAFDINLIPFSSFQGDIKIVYYLTPRGRMEKRDQYLSADYRSFFQEVLKYSNMQEQRTFTSFIRDRIPKMNLNTNRSNGSNSIPMTMTQQQQLHQQQVVSMPTVHCITGVELFGFFITKFFWLKI